jgi:hypothetical protein
MVDVGCHYAVAEVGIPLGGSGEKTLVVQRKNSPKISQMCEVDIPEVVSPGPNVMMDGQLGVTWSRAPNGWQLSSLSSILFLLGPFRDPDAAERAHIRIETCAQYNYNKMVWHHCNEVYGLCDGHEKCVKR